MLTANQPRETSCEACSVILVRVFLSVCPFSAPKVMAALCTVMSFFFFYLIDRKHQILRAHNAARPRVDCKFLLVVFCGCIDLKSVCIAFLLSLSPSPSLWLLCEHFMDALLSDYVPLPLHCWLMTLQLPFGSQDLSVMWEKSTDRFCFFCIHAVVDVSRLRNHIETVFIATERLICLSLKWLLESTEMMQMEHKTLFIANLHQCM